MAVSEGRERRIDWGTALQGALLTLAVTRAAGRAGAHPEGRRPRRAASPPVDRHRAGGLLVASPSAGTVAARQQPPHRARCTRRSASAPGVRRPGDLLADPPRSSPARRSAPRSSSVSCWSARSRCRLGMLGGYLAGAGRRRPVSILVVDVGTSGVRAAVVAADGRGRARALPRGAAVVARARASSSSTPRRWPTAVLDVAPARAGRRAARCDAVGIANQRASTHRVGPRHRRARRARHRLAGPAHRRHVPRCCRARASGWRPNASATKLAFLLDMADPDRARDLCFGTVDTWVAWTLSGGDRPRHRRARNAGGHRPGARRRRRAGHAHDPRRAAHPAVGAADDRRLERASSGTASALPGAPPIAGHRRRPAGVARRPGLHPARAGQDHLRHRRHARPVRRARPGPRSRPRGDGGCFPIVAWRRDGVDHVGHRGGDAVGRHAPSSGCATTSASSPSAAESEAVAASRATTPATCGSCPRCSAWARPTWDFGARGTLLGLTRGTGRAEVVRAVLEGVAHRGADLVEAAEADGGVPHRVAAGRRRHDRQRACSCRRWPTPPSARSRCRPCSRRRPWAPPTWPAWPSGVWADEDDVAGVVVAPGRGRRAGARQRPTATAGAGRRPGHADRARAQRPRLLTTGLRRRDDGLRLRDDRPAAPSGRSTDPVTPPAYPRPSGPFASPLWPRHRDGHVPRRPRPP